MFLAYNNGIAAIAGKVKTEKVHNEYKITHADNFQIVNGGQTTAAIHEAHKRGVGLKDVYVQVKLNVSTTHSADTNLNISQFANSQNRMQIADFLRKPPIPYKDRGAIRKH